MEKFDDFFEDQFDQENNSPQYHTPDKKPQKTDRKQVTIICLSVLIVVMVITMLVNAIVLATMKTSIENDYIASMKQDMEDAYNNQLNEVVKDKNLQEDLKDAAIDSLKLTVGELAKEKHWNSVVEITSTNYNGNQVIGSGFLIEKDLGISNPGKDNLYIITNAHVVAEQCFYSSRGADYLLHTNIKATFAPSSDKAKYDLSVMYFGSYKDKYLNAEKNRPDLAILKFTVPPDKTQHKPIEIKKGSQVQIEEGDPSAVIGSPQGIGLSISAGIISKTNLNFGTSMISTGTFFMTDAAINGGNSGGPVFNKSGDLIGVVESKLVKEDIESMGFAISLDTLNSFLSNLEAQHIVK